MIVSEAIYCEAPQSYIVVNASKLYTSSEEHDVMSITLMDPTGHVRGSTSASVVLL